VNFEEFMRIVKARRTVRVYKSDPIPDDYVDKVIEAGRWAPTGANSQPFEFLIVKKRETKEQIRQIVEGAAMVTSHAERSPPGTKRTFLATAPILILVLGDPRYKEVYPKGSMRDEIFQASLSAAVENMHLAATALGLGGSIWLTVAPTAGMKIKELLNIPQIFFLKTIMPLGYAETAPSPPVKREPVCHEERYDMRKFRNDEEISELIEESVLFKGRLTQKWIV
jgi:FMN reductase (NADPH)